MRLEILGIDYDEFLCELHIDTNQQIMHTEDRQMVPTEGGVAVRNLSWCRECASMDCARILERLKNHPDLRFNLHGIRFDGNASYQPKTERAVRSKASVTLGIFFKWVEESVKYSHDRIYRPTSVVRQMRGNMTLLDNSIQSRVDLNDRLSPERGMLGTILDVPRCVVESIAAFSLMTQMLRLWGAVDSIPLLSSCTNKFTCNVTTEFLTIRGG